MTSLQKPPALVIAIVVGALAVLVVAFVANGAERDGAWLYAMAGVVALSGLLSFRGKPKD